MKDQTVSDRAEQLASKAAGKAEDAVEQVQSAAKEQFDQLEKTIRRNPVASVSIAAGVGLLLAIIARR